MVTTRDLGSIWRHVGAAAATLAALGVAAFAGEAAVSEASSRWCRSREFESYYGRQILKTPTWKTPDVPLYLFLGGLAGASALLAEGAALDRPPATSSGSPGSPRPGAPRPARSPWSTTSAGPSGS